MRALLAGANGEDSDGDGGDIEAIQAMENKRQMPISEEEAFRRDVDSRPDEVRPLPVSHRARGSFHSSSSFPSVRPGTLSAESSSSLSLHRPVQSNASDYERVPVANFGLALLKGMGWKEGQAASKHRKGLEQAYVPKARPALLGIGATERAVPELGKGEKAKPKWKVKEEAKKYVPIMRVDRNGSASGSGAAVSVAFCLGLLRVGGSEGGGGGRRKNAELTRLPPSSFTQTPTALSRPGTPSSSSTPNRRTSRSASPPRRRRDDDREPSSSSSSRRDDRDREPSSSSSSSRYRERDDRESSSSSRRDRDDRDRRDRERDSRPRERSRSREREKEDRDRRRRRDEEGGGRSGSRREEETEDERRERKRKEKERDGGGDRDRDRERRRDDDRRR